MYKALCFSNLAINFMYNCVCIYGEIVIIVGMVTATRVQTLDKAVCITDSASTFAKGIHLDILLPAMDK